METLPVPATYLIAASALLVLILGVIHLIYTFFGDRLAPRDPALRRAMQADSPGITRQTTIWRAWVGFNASHSLGAMLFGLVFGYLALRQGPLLLASWFLCAVGLAMLVALTLLARRYWFRTPLVVIALATLLFLTGVVLGQG